MNIQKRFSWDVDNYYCGIKIMLKKSN